MFLSGSYWKPQSTSFQTKFKCPTQKYYYKLKKKPPSTSFQTQTKIKSEFPTTKYYYKMTE